MNKEQFLKINDELDKKCRDTWIKKNNDYSNGKDVLSNFAKSAHRFEEPIHMSLLHEIDKKDIRLIELLSKGKEPANESIEDSIEDMIVYLKLLYASLSQEKSDEKDVNPKKTRFDYSDVPPAPRFKKQQDQLNSDKNKKKKDDMDFTAEEHEIYKKLRYVELHILISLFPENALCLSHQNINNLLNNGFVDEEPMASDIGFYSLTAKGKDFVEKTLYFFIKCTKNYEQPKRMNNGLFPIPIFQAGFLQEEIFQIHAKNDIAGELLHDFLQQSLNGKEAVFNCIYDPKDENICVSTIFRFVDKEDNKDLNF